MTRKDLKAYRGNKREIDYLQRKLASRPSTVTDSVMGSATEFPYIEGVIPVRGIDWQKHEGQRQRLRKLEQECKAVDDFINGIEDSRLRLSVTLRYIEGQSWEQVATNAGDEVDGEAIRKATWRYLRKFS